MTDQTPKGPLSDLKVVEMGTLIAGPFCGQVLGDFGADVVKVEDPGKGDPMRQWGRSLPKGLSPWWPVIGRNKRSVALDLRQPEGRELALALIDQADVLINARLAADAAGATKMDRPEWGAVDPFNGNVYITLTNNNSTLRSVALTDAANPRS